MNKALDTLSRTGVLIGSLIAMIAIGFSFSFVMPELGGALLDMQTSGDTARDLVASWSDDQRRLHIWATAGLDSAYPLAYGAFYAGLLARLAPTRRSLFVLPVLVGVVADFAENAVQVAGLLGATGLLSAKDILTPIKFGAIFLALGLIVVLAVIAGVRWIRNLGRST